jgi:hypothetical protein
LVLTHLVLKKPTIHSAEKTSFWNLIDKKINSKPFFDQAAIEWH